MAANLEGAGHVAVASDVVAVMSNQESSIDHFDRPDTFVAVRAWVPLEGLAGCWVEGSDLVAVDDIWRESRSRSFSETAVVVGEFAVAWPRLGGARSFDRTEMATDVDGVARDAHRIGAVEVSGYPYRVVLGD